MVWYLLVLLVSFEPCAVPYSCSRNGCDGYGQDDGSSFGVFELGGHCGLGSAESWWGFHYQFVAISQGLEICSSLDSTRQSRATPN